MLDLRRLLKIPAVAHLLHDSFFFALANESTNRLIDVFVRAYLNRYIRFSGFKPLDCHDYPTPDEPDQLVPESVVVMRPLIDVKPATTSTSSAP